MAKKLSWSGADLMRAPSPTEEKQSQEAPQEQPKEKPQGKSRLGRIRTRRVMRGPDGEIIDLTEKTPVWLVQIDPINQIFLKESLTTEGYDLEFYDLMQKLPPILFSTEEKPKLIIFEARSVGQQTPYFRKMILPLLEKMEIPSLLVGVMNDVQEQSFRRWYQGEMLSGGDVGNLKDYVQRLIGE